MSAVSPNPTSGKAPSTSKSEEIVRSIRNCPHFCPQALRTPHRQPLRVEGEWGGDPQQSSTLTLTALGKGRTGLSSPQE